MATHHATGGLNRLGIAIELIAIPFDVVQAISHDNNVWPQRSLDGRVFQRSCRLLTLGVSIHRVVDTEIIVTHRLDAKALDARILRLSDFVLTEVRYLPCSIGLA